MSNDSEKIQEYLSALEHVRYEGQLLWQIFGAYLLAHTVFLAFLLHAIFAAGSVVQWRIATFIAGVIGLLLCVPWMASYLRSSAYYVFRMAQARAKEPSGWNLIGGDGKDFAAGKRVTVDGESYQIPGIAQVLRTKRSVPLLVAVFAVVYLGVAVASAPWWPE